MWNDQPDEWERISEEAVLKKLKDYYLNPKILIQEMKENPGRVIRMSAYSHVRYVNQEQRD
jgi:hypothetical protein